MLSSGSTVASSRTSLVVSDVDDDGLDDPRLAAAAAAAAAAEVETAVVAEAVPTFSLPPSSASLIATLAVAAFVVAAAAAAAAAVAVAEVVAPAADIDGARERAGDLATNSAPFLLTTLTLLPAPLDRRPLVRRISSGVMLTLSLAARETTEPAPPLREGVEKPFDLRPRETRGEPEPAGVAASGVEGTATAAVSPPPSTVFNTSALPSLSSIAAAESRRYRTRAHTQSSCSVRVAGATTQIRAAVTSSTA